MGEKSKIDARPTQRTHAACNKKNNDGDDENKNTREIVLKTYV